METDNAELKKTYVKNQACFRQLSQEEVDVLASLLIEKNIPANTTIVVEGDPVDSVFLIIEGEAEVQHIRIINKERVVKKVTTLKPGDSIGLNEQGFYSLSGIRTATVVAKTDMKVFQLNVPAFHGFALAYPHVNEVMRAQARTYYEGNL